MNPLIEIIRLQAAVDAIERVAAMTADEWAAWLEDTSWLD